MGLLIELTSEEKLLNKIRLLFKESIKNVTDISFDMFCEALCTDNCIQPIFDVHIKQYVHNMDARHSRSTGTTIIHDNLSNTSEQSSRNSERASNNLSTQRSYGRTLPSLTELGFLDSEAHSIFRLRGSSPGPEIHPEFPNVQIITDPSLSRRLNDMLSMSLGASYSSNSRSNTSNMRSTNEENSRSENITPSRGFVNLSRENASTDQSDSIFNHLSRQSANGTAIDSLSEPTLIGSTPSSRNISFPTSQVSNNPTQAVLNNTNSTSENPAVPVSTLDLSTIFHPVYEVEPSASSSFRNAQQDSGSRQNGILRSIRNRRSFSSISRNHNLHPYLNSNRLHTNVSSSVPLNTNDLESNLNSSTSSTSRAPDELIDRFFGFSPGSLRF